MNSYANSSVRRAMFGAVSALILIASCASDDSSSVDTTAIASATPTATTAAGSDSTAAASNDCASVIATFRAVVSANPDLADPSLVVTCDGDTVVSVQTNSMPDYLYIEASPGEPEASDLTFRIPLTSVVAATPSDVPLLGPIAVAINGVAIYGPTEATGGDVLSLVGALSECGSHNGPTGFHMHLFLWAAGVDCLYDASEIEAGGSLQVGWSLDGYRIMSGLVCADDTCSSTHQLTSSWQLTDDSLFASDTWNAHSYVEGSGDLDQCNGRVDADGEYRYYTTPTFPYFLGCYRGTVAADAGGGLTGNGGPP